MRSIPLDTRRVVLLVPESGISLLREFRTPEVFLSLADKSGTFDNHFLSIHMSYVRVRRGSGELNVEANVDEWRSLNDRLSVRDAREDDSGAELMVSAVVPTFGLLVLPHASVELRLSPRDGHEVFSAPREIKKRLDMALWKRAVFFKANLADPDRTAILTPDQAGQPETHRIPRHLTVPAKALGGASGTDSPGIDDEQGSRGQESGQEFRHGDSAVRQSVELTRQELKGGGVRTACTVTLRMASDYARRSLQSAGPRLETTLDLCAVCVTFGEAFCHTIHFPFPIKWNAIHIKFSKRQGFVVLTVPPADRPFQLPVTRVADSVSDNSSCSLVLPSSLFWSPCAPLSSLPKLDFKAEWAHQAVSFEFCCHYYPAGSLAYVGTSVLFVTTITLRLTFT